MAKWSRKILGSVLTGKEGKGPYIKMSDDVVLKKGDCVNLENESFQRSNLSEGVEAGRVNSELEKAIKATIDKTPWYKKGKDGAEDTGFVLFQIVRITKQE